MSPEASQTTGAGGREGPEAAQPRPPHEAYLQAAVGTALAAAVFTTVVGITLAVNQAGEDASNPLDSGVLLSLKKRLLDQPKDQEARTRYRALDLELRKEFFRRQALWRSGRYLLLGGFVVLLAGLKVAADLRRKTPSPGVGAGAPDAELRERSFARRSVAAFGALVGASAAVLALVSVGGLGAARLAEDGPMRSPEGRQQAAPYFPSEEEIGRNWPRFRGPNGMGVAVPPPGPGPGSDSGGTGYRASWDGRAGEGILWKAAVPLKGASSPVVWGDRVFLTGADKERREVYCFGSDTGELLWRRRVENVPGGGLVAEEVWDDKTHAAATPVADGRRVCATFVNGDLACFDFAGRRVWARGLGPVANAYGHAASLAMHRDRLIVQLDQSQTEDGEWRSKLMALDAATGLTVWEAARQVPESWATPVVVSAAGREQIITCAEPWVTAYDAETGDEIWRADCLSGYVTPSPVFAGGLVLAAMEGVGLTAIRPDGRGDVTETHVAWTYDQDLPSIPSPVSDGKLVFVVDSSGIVTCLDLDVGREIWKEDAEVAFLASPTLVGDRVYLFGDDGAGVIIRAQETYEVIARPELGEYVQASPAFVGGRIYVRGEEHLFCIAREGEGVSASPGPGGGPEEDVESDGRRGPEEKVPAQPPPPPEQPKEPVEEGQQSVPVQPVKDPGQAGDGEEGGDEEEFVDWE